MNRKQLTHGRTCVYNVNYHVVFSTKYRKKVLTPEIAVFLQQTFTQIASEKGFILQQAEIGERDHVHLFLSGHPKVSPSYMVKMLKGISARRLFMKFPEIQKELWKGRLWNPSFYLETVGSISEETIRQYIENQSND